MKISYKWLKSIIPFDWTVNELAKKLTMSGTEVEAIENFGGRFDRIVTAELKSVARHPDADKLTICEVYDGSEIYSVVCGAPNVAAGQKVLFAKKGASLPDGFIIKKAKLRGVESSGMICSWAELRLGEDASGIAVLPDNTEIGQPVGELSGGEDFVLEMEVTPNRPDCLSHRGIAREVQALGGSRLHDPDIIINETGNDVSVDVGIEIENPEDCPRYSARVIKNVTIGPSPPWLVAKLYALGIKSINNVVDVTNYVMMEYGHPLHAFDFDLFTGKKVIVRGAQAGEKFTTLDEVERILPEGSILITDGSNPVALGGIMGGLNSEVSNDTKNILLESAYFNPVRIRSTAKAVRLSTESSQRFERGADRENLTLALNRAAQLINDLARGEVSKGIADCYPEKHQMVQISLRISEANRLLGTDLGIDRVKSILESLDIRSTDENGETLLADIPPFRPDLTRPADLIEEISRIYGFDNIPTSEILAGSINVSIPNSFHISGIIREFFAGAGFDEVVNWVLYDSKKYSKLEFEFNPVEISNPLSEDTAVLRPHLWGSLLDNISYNLNRNLNNIRIFEIGYAFNASMPGKLPEQDLRFVLAWTGNSQKTGWGNTLREVDLFDLKGLAEDFFNYHFIKNYGINKRQSEQSRNPFLDNNYSLEISIDNKPIGELGKISSKAASLFDIKIPVWMMSLNLEMIKDKPIQQGYYTEPPKFPPSDRDIAIVVDRDLPVGGLLESISGIGEKYLEAIRLFDIYIGKQIPQDKKSLALSLRFRHRERTLTDDETDKALKNIISRLKSKYALDLRG